jgi:DNA polymerase-3 subunit delta
MTDTAVHLVKGGDPTLRANEVNALVERLLAGEDRTYALEEFEIASRRRGGDDGDDGADGSSSSGADAPDVLRSIVNALSTPPFVTSRRVVVVRNVAALDAAGAAVLAESVAAPLDGTFLVLVQEGGKMPSALDKALKSTGAEVVGPASEKTGDVLVEALRSARLRLSAPARERVIAHLGEDAGRVPELVSLLGAAFGGGAELDVDDVEPYLGDAGTVARWALGDAIDAGDTAAALEVLERLLHATSGVQQKALHPMQLMATLTGHYLDLARLDAPGVATKDDAHSILGGHPFTAQKKLRAAQRLESDGIAEAIGLLADADVDLRGGFGGRRAVPDTVTLELLVARLAALKKRRGATASSGTRRR